MIELSDPQSNNKTLIQAQRRLVQVIAALIFFSGLSAIFRPIAERLPERIESLLMAGNYAYLTRSLDIFLGITLIYFSYQLTQRKLVAWWIALVSSSVLAMAHLLGPGRIDTAILPLTGVVALLISKDYFKARSKSSSLKQGLVALLVSIIIALGYGTAGFWLMRHRDFGLNFSFSDALVRTLRAYLLLGNPDLHPHTRHARWFLDSLGLLGASSFLYGFYSLFRPLEYRFRHAPEDRDRAEQIIKQYSLSSEDWFKLWPMDKSYFFASDHTAIIAYGVRSGVAICVGDPTGDSASIELAIREFDRYCTEKGWSPCFMYASEQLLEIYERLGFNSLKVGEDAVVDLSAFAEQTANDKNFRNINNRFVKAEFSFSRQLPPHSRALLTQLSATSKDWLKLPDKKDWCFFAGSYSKAYMELCPVFVVTDQSGRVQAFANEIPGYYKGHVTIDLMRHRRKAPNSIMDFMLRQILLDRNEQGYGRFNLGLAPLSGLGEEAGKPEEKLLHLIYKANQSFLSFQGLRQFKSKFDPEWQSKYVAYRGTPARLPLIAYALNKLMTLD